MDLEILKSKTVPISEETILWFEFLLKPNLLTTHLSKPLADPTPTELITQFLSIAPENQNQNDLNSPDVDTLNKNEGLKMSRKQLALKILALKVAAYVKWNLEMFEKSLPLQKQVQLLSDLCSVTAGKTVNLPLSLVHECPIGPEGSTHSLNFALTLYHRWVLRAQVLRGAMIKSNKPYIHVPGVPDQAPYTIRDDLFINSLEPFTQTSIDFLNQIIADPEPFRILTYDTFVALDANIEGIHQRFDSAIAISKAEIKAQIHYDLCLYYLYVKKYDLATQNIILSRDNLKEVEREYSSKDFLYCNIAEEELNGYLLACGVTDQKLGLLQRMNASIQHKFTNLVEILKEDNLKREIPTTQRKILELDIEGQASMPNGNGKELKELETKVVALNAIRYVLDEDNILSNDIFMQKHKAQMSKIVELMFEYADDAFFAINLSERDKLKQYFLNMILMHNNWNQVEMLTKKYNKIFSVQEIEDLKKQKLCDEVQVSGIGAQFDWNSCESKMNRLEVGLLERQLITCTSATAVRKLLVKIAGTNPTKPLWSINPSWAIPIPLKSMLMSLSRGFLQDFAYILLGKAKEMTSRGDFTPAILLLSVLKNETQRPELANNPTIAKLGRLVGWEALLIHIIQTLEEWPKKPIDQPTLIRNCKQCFLSLTGSDAVIPRLKILEYCAAMLLNLNEWSSVVLPDKRFPTLEMSVAFAQAVLDIDKFKGNKKTNREAWDLVLPMFLNQQNSRQRHNADNPFMMYTFLKKLRDPLIISIILSLLAKLHNLLKDESNLELNAEYMFLWPTNIGNSNVYNIKAVAETLNNLLNQALKYYPNNIPWIKLKGDLEFVNGNYESAMKYYVTAIIAGSEYCTMHLQRPLIDDYIVRRMIKCSSNLGCYMQAAVLCQFLDETDYVLAFKSISEKTSNSSDAMDSYYSCIWDPTLLEFIVNWHCKKGEHKRRLQAISFLGQLELNANNNDEIKREAASIRKIRFLRSLAKQYMF